MKEKESLVTVAIPTFNRADYLKTAIQSALEQDYQNLEILISDNGSTDNTESVVKGFKDARIVYYRQEKNIGMVSNWNFCLDHAKGKFFLLLSDDDVLEGKAITALVSHLQSPSVTIAYARFLFVDADLQPLRPSYPSPSIESGNDFIVNSLKGLRELVPSVTMQRTTDAKQVGGYPSLGTATDMALRLYLAKTGTVAYAPEVLLKYRQHETSLSSNLEGVFASFESFSNSVNHIGNPLYDYRDSFPIYFKKTLLSMVLQSESLDRRKRQAIIGLSRRLDLGRDTEFLLKIFNMRLFKYVAQIRRKIKLLAAVR